MSSFSTTGLNSMLCIICYINSNKLTSGHGYKTKKKSSNFIYSVTCYIMQCIRSDIIYLFLIICLLLLLLNCVRQNYMHNTIYDECYFSLNSYFPSLVTE
jgi:hypothetical protein